MHVRRHTEHIAESGEAIQTGSYLFLLLALLVLLQARCAPAQSGVAAGGALRMDKADLPTAINQHPDANVQMRSRTLRASREKLDAVNEERIRAIADESSKLLLLARDLQSRLDKIGTQPLPSLVVREAEVIEKLAHDVQARMAATIGRE